MIKDEFEKSVYEAYKLLWLIQHGFTLEKMVSALADADNEAKEHDDYPEGNTWEIYENLVARVEETGFGNGSIWACFDEFMDNEFQDSGYMKELLSLMPGSDKLRVYYARNYSNFATCMKATEFCKFFNFTLREESGVKNGDEYAFIVIDDQGTLENRYIKWV